ncbi:MAG: hypothetical protein CVU00_03250 [Bacteroidetes bacterium HGW-Bacteroidetes-17]|jgi:hypothetical protein|nr:MAG: hypothetical protein CVU00_03250 [Bacteroidetes bacterium HGW-Bacteroidetes-17]
MNNWMELKPGYILIIFVLIIATGCGAARKIIKEPLKEEGIDYLFEKLKENELKFDQFNAKFNLEYVHNKKKTEFKGQVRIKKDSMIWVSFSPALGIEAARMLITYDSVKFINRMNKTYFEGDYNYLNDFLDTNIDFDVLQALILGNDLSHYEDGKFRASIENKLYKLATASRSKLKRYIRSHEIDPIVFIQSIWLLPETFKISQLSLKEIKKENKKLQANYSKFMELDKQLFPRVVDFDLQAESKIEVHLVFSKITINEELNYPFNVPVKFNLITKFE